MKKILSVFMLLLGGILLAHAQPQFCTTCAWRGVLQIDDFVGAKLEVDVVVVPKSSSQEMASLDLVAVAVRQLRPFKACSNPVSTMGFKLTGFLLANLEQRNMLLSGNLQTDAQCKGEPVALIPFLLDTHKLELQDKIQVSRPKGMTYRLNLSMLPLEQTPEAVAAANQALAGIKAAQEGQQQAQQAYNQTAQKNFADFCKTCHWRGTFENDFYAGQVLFIPITNLGISMKYKGQAIFRSAKNSIGKPPNRWSPTLFESLLETIEFYVEFEGNTMISTAQMDVQRPTSLDKRHKALLQVGFDFKHISKSNFKVIQFTQKIAKNYTLKINLQLEPPVLNSILPDPPANPCLNCVFKGKINTLSYSGFPVTSDLALYPSLEDPSQYLATGTVKLAGAPTTQNGKCKIVPYTPFQFEKISTLSVRNGEYYGFIRAKGQLNEVCQYTQRVRNEDIMLLWTINPKVPLENLKLVGNKMRGSSTVQLLDKMLPLAWDLTMTQASDNELAALRKAGIGISDQICTTCTWRGKSKGKTTLSVPFEADIVLTPTSQSSTFVGDRVEYTMKATLRFLSPVGRTHQDKGTKCTIEKHPITLEVTGGMTLFVQRAEFVGAGVTVVSAQVKCNNAIAEAAFSRSVVNYFPQPTPFSTNPDRLNGVFEGTTWELQVQR